MDRPKAGQLEERAEPVTVDGQKIRGVVPYNAMSRDMGGWQEVIHAGALDGAKLDDLVVTVDHAGLPLGRYPTTLTLEDRSDGLHWQVDPPRSRQDVIEAIERGDLKAGSFRMKVARDEWRGDVRHIHQIAELRDVSIVTAPAYEAAVVEYRSLPAEAEEDTTMATEADKDTEVVEETATETTETEDRARPASAGLRIEDRTSEQPKLGLAEEFRAAGFPGRAGERAVIDFKAEQFEDRAVTWTGSVDNISKDRFNAGAFGYDQRWAWPAFARVPVEYGVTSVDVLTQTARTLASAANVVRAVTAVTAKPETASTLTLVTTAMKQVATIESGIPNVYLESPAFNSVIETDLRLSLNDGLDKLVLDFIATSGFQAPGTDVLLVSIRKAMTTLFAAGYNPDTLLLTPAAAEGLDVAVSGIASGTQDFVFSPGQFAPGTIFGMQRRISKTIPASAVVDSTALGKMYASPVTLARFEEAAGSTNTSTVRMELNAVFGGERTAAAVRIAAS